ncbi:MAG: dTDP-4-amino-4,6-dideoxygalactose transaminase [Luteitalea sp.]|nr:dTDP-4-amino-4,6-dideoxygalactose transaminase [Luteitalea sp.]
MPPPRIPFNRASFEESEWTAMREAVAGGHISGNGTFTRRCEARLEQQLGAARVLLTTSGTHALEMAAFLLDLGPGDEVILPSFTFVSTANAFVLRGARPIFVDIRDDTLNLDETQLNEVISARTRAIVPVHYGGVGCEMDAIQALARLRGLAIVEDNAHGLFGRYKERALGSFGRFAALSFHETKNVTCGEGGALVVNDESQVNRAEIIREKGTNRAAFFRGDVEKYTWIDVGSSYVMSELLAACLLAQLDRHDASQARRRAVCERYAADLAGWARSNGIRLPFVPSTCSPAFHLFYLRFPNGDSRDRFLAFMWDRGVYCAFHYVPLHTAPMGQHFGGRQGALPVTERASRELVRLPLFASLTEDELELIIEAVLAFDEF